MAKWNTVEAIQSGIQQYQQQHAEAIRILTEVQQQAIKLEGAIAALEQLLANAKIEEETTKARPDDPDFTG